MTSSVCCFTLSGAQEILSHQGQPLCPMVTEPHVSGTPISSAQVWMPPGHIANVHVHDETWVIVVVLFGGAVTLQWDFNGDISAVHHRPGDHVVIPAGVPHTAVCTVGPVIAIEARSNGTFDADNRLLPELQAEAGLYVAEHDLIRVPPARWASPALAPAS
jgi:uncharacterized RmlC-like cupin family protein